MTDMEKKKAFLERVIGKIQKIPERKMDYVEGYLVGISDNFDEAVLALLKKQPEPQRSA